VFQILLQLFKIAQKDWTKNQMTVQLQLDEKTTLTKLQQDANDTLDIKVLKNLNISKHENYIISLWIL